MATESLKGFLALNGGRVSSNEHLQGGVTRNKHQRINKDVGSGYPLPQVVPGEVQSDGVTNPTLQANGLRQDNMSGRSRKRCSHDIVSRDGVTAGTAGWNRPRPDNRYLHLLPHVWKLGLIAYDSIILHREWNIADLKFYNSTFGDQSKSSSSPCSGSTHHTFPLKYRAPLSEQCRLSLIGVMIQIDTVEARFHHITLSANHVIPAAALTSL